MPLEVQVKLSYLKKKRPSSIFSGVFFSKNPLDYMSVDILGAFFLFDSFVIFIILQVCSGINVFSWFFSEDA